MTKLQAINRILRAGGVRAVSDLDTDGSSDAAEAERVLDETELDMQSKGWNYNTRRGVTLTPDATTSKIAVPGSVISIDTSGASRGTNVTVFGDSLYDADENRDTFEGNLVVDYILRIEFACIPHTLQAAIVAEATIRFLETRKPEKLGAWAYRNRDRAWGEAKRAESYERDIDLTDTDHARRTGGNRRRYIP